MHILQPKHTKLKPEELKKLLDTFRISVGQLPKIKATDPGVPEGAQRGDVIRIERIVGDSKQEYYRVVI